MKVLVADNNNTIKLNEKGSFKPFIRGQFGNNKVISST